MRITTNSTHLAKALTLAKMLQSGKQTLGVHEATYLHIGKDASTLEAHTPAWHLSMPVPMTADTEGVIAVNTAHLHKVVSALQGSIQLDADTDGMSLSITHKHGKCVLPLQPCVNAVGESIEPQAREFSADATDIALPCWADLMTMYNRGCALRTTDATRWFANVCSVEIADSTMTLASTDGRALYSASCKDARLTENAVFCLPKALRGIFAKIDADEVQITYEDKGAYQLRISTDAMTLTMQIDRNGDYPRWRNVIARFDDWAKVDTEALRQCVSRVTSFGGSEVLRLEIDGTELSLTSRDGDMFTEARESISIEDRSEASLTIGVQSGLLLWMLSHAKDTATLRYKEASKPMYIETSDKGIAQYAMIMPCNLPDED